MDKNFDVSKPSRNPYVKKLKKQITIRLEKETLEYFKTMASDIDIPYQKLINLFLRNCAENGKKPEISWKSDKKFAA
jgi:predicted DNA binding CopG/RHH family protein